MHFITSNWYKLVHIFSFHLSLSIRERVVKECCYPSTALYAEINMSFLPRKHLNDFHLQLHLRRRDILSRWGDANLLNKYNLFSPNCNWRNHLGEIRAPVISCTTCERSKSITSINHARNKSFEVQRRQIWRWSE